MVQEEKTSTNPEPRDAPLHRFAGLRLVSLLTLCSRVLGLVRDILMASRFGNGPLLDAFTVAFRIPNLARRLFGEGALSTAFLPTLVGRLENQDHQSAWRLSTAVLVTLAGTLSMIVLVGETGLLTGRAQLPSDHPVSFLLELTAIMLPYLLLICLAAQISAIFHALGRFGWPALSPVVLNLVWILALVGTGGSDWSLKTQMRIVCWAILVAGVIQLLLPLLVLRKHGFRFIAATTEDRETVRQIARTMVPILLGLSVTQLNVLADSLIAWGMSAQEGFAASDWRPLNAGTASALYLGQRLYQFPIGVFGVALGTVLFPRFARHAEQRQFSLLADDLLDGMKLVLAIGIPAGVGLIVIAHPLAEVLFQRGEFNADDTLQTSHMIRAYGVGVWAFCSLLIVNRAYFAMRDYSTPLRIGIATVITNLVLNFTLIWPLGGAGLALATSLASMFQVLVSIRLMKSRLNELRWSVLIPALWKSLLATSMMALACWSVLQILELASLWRLLASLVTAVIVYLGTAKAIGLQEPFDLLSGRKK
ncbi:murein biosynthesis integral membrane protein MurJ [Planctomycetaceae bacterium]|nr:murein biosynthesis integral membrane protein MurJ [bacterium]MDC0262133.1 murein biosynthesis integral membrane protein MurJ [Planctomycetaceae bacterium]MDG2391666.1 murein biosynthesis integral membrane protein MurJ [Planctomycetaceae bacterium]